MLRQLWHRIKNKTYSKHTHTRTQTHMHTHSQQQQQTQLTTMTPSINSERVDVCCAGLHCEKNAYSLD